MHSTYLIYMNSIYRLMLKKRDVHDKHLTRSTVWSHGTGCIQCPMAVFVNWCYIVVWYLRDNNLRSTTVWIMKWQNFNFTEKAISKQCTTRTHVCSTNLAIPVHRPKYTVNFIFFDVSGLHLKVIILVIKCILYRSWIVGAGMSSLLMLYNIARQDWTYILTSYKFQRL